MAGPAVHRVAIQETQISSLGDFRGGDYRLWKNRDWRDCTEDLYAGKLFREFGRRFIRTNYCRPQ